MLRVRAVGTRLARCLVAAAAAAAVPQAAVPAAVAVPAGLPGSCRTSTGTTVVVDFTALDGRTVTVRCVREVPATGFAALRTAGFPVTQPAQTPGFLCRISGTPAATQVLPVRGVRDGYREQCQRTPPQDAYWAYWQARNGGQWTFSDEGAGSSEPIAGGFEGWSFQLNRGGGRALPPKVEPVRGIAPGGPGHGAGEDAEKDPDREGTDAGPGASPGPDDRPGSSRSPGASPDENAGARAGSGVVVTTEPPAPPTANPGSPLGTVLGVGLLVLVVAGAGLTAWRRRP